MEEEDRTDEEGGRRVGDGVLLCVEKKRDELEGESREVAGVGRGGRIERGLVKDEGGCGGEWAHH